MVQTDPILERLEQNNIRMQHNGSQHFSYNPYAWYTRSLELSATHFLITILEVVIRNSEQWIQRKPEILRKEEVGDVLK